MQRDSLAKPLDGLVVLAALVGDPAQAVTGLCLIRVGLQDLVVAFPRSVEVARLLIHLGRRKGGGGRCHDTLLRKETGVGSRFHRPRFDPPDEIDSRRLLFKRVITCFTVPIVPRPSVVVKQVAHSDGRSRYRKNPQEPTRPSLSPS